MKRDYQTHVFTSTYTADVSGVCSALYELGGMTVLHDPSGCNSTYSTHDEPRWFDTDSLMYVSGLDEVTAVMGDDTVLIRDVVQAARDLKPRFITLCGASIPHIIAFDYRGVAHLIEEACGIPVLPVPTDGLRSYCSGVGLAFNAWLERFADPALHEKRQGKAVNLLGVTPLDFSVNGNVRALRQTIEEGGFTINCCMAMGDSFEQMSRAYMADVNLVVSSAGRQTAKYMKKKSGIPCVEGLPIGAQQSGVVLQMLRQTIQDGISRTAWQPQETEQPADGAEQPQMQPAQGAAAPLARDRFAVPAGGILVIGEEIFARSLAAAINRLPKERRYGLRAAALWPDVNEGMPEQELIRAMRSSRRIIADPLYQVVLRPQDEAVFRAFPHEAYSGRIFREDIPVFAGRDYAIEQLL